MVRGRRSLTWPGRVRSSGGAGRSSLRWAPEPVRPESSILAEDQSGNRAQDGVEVLASAEVPRQARQVFRWLMPCSTRIRLNGARGGLSAEQQPRTLSMPDALVRSSNTYFLAWRTSCAVSRARCRWPSGWGCSSSTTRACRSRSSTTTGVVHLRAGVDQPACPGQRLLHAGSQRHPVRAHAGDRRARPERGAAHHQRRPAGRPG
jgi:hypothetical protein